MKQAVLTYALWDIIPPKLHLPVGSLPPQAFPCPRPPLNEKLFPVHRPSGLKMADWNFFFFFFSFFSTGLVRLYVAGLPLRSCRTIGAPSVQGSAQCAFFLFLVAARFEPMYFSLGSEHLNHYPILTPMNIGQVVYFHHIYIYIYLFYLPPLYILIYTNMK